MDFPKDLRYTKDHEWARVQGRKAVVGITAFAVEQLGDITMIDLPAVGAQLAAGATCGVVESVKSVSDIYAPLSGKVLAVNTALTDAPELVNSAPYADGWLFELEPANESELAGLLDPQAYAQLVAESA